MLLTGRNLTYYADLMAGMRDAIASGQLATHSAGVRAGWALGAESGGAHRVQAGSDILPSGRCPR